MKEQHTTENNIDARLPIVEAKYSLDKIQENFELLLKVLNGPYSDLKSLNPIPELAYISSDQFDFIRNTNKLREEMLIKSLVIGGCEGGGEITDYKLNYISKNIPSLTKKEYISVLEDLITGDRNVKIGTAKGQNIKVKVNNITLIAEKVLNISNDLKAHYNLNENLMLSPNSRLWKDEFKDLIFQSKKIDIYKNEIFLLVGADIFNLFFSKHFDFLVKIPPEILLFNEFVTDPGYLLNDVICRAPFQKTNTDCEKSYCLENFIHETGHYI